MKKNRLTGINYLYIFILPFLAIQCDQQEKEKTLLDLIIEMILAEQVIENLQQNCQPSEQESEIARLMQNHPEQQRPSLNCDPILERIARERAQDMADRSYFSHTNPDGYGPNYLVRQAGYPLPSFYSDDDDGNNIESIAAGNSTPDATWTQWMNSAGHKRHLVAEINFYAEQIDYGIGYAAKPGSTYTYYWVALTARKE